MWQTDPDNGNQPSDVAPANFLDWSLQATSSYQLAPMDPTSLDFTEGAEPEVFLASHVSAEFFEALGVTAVLGRTFVPEEFAVGNGPVAVLTDALWRRRFAADPDLAGRVLRLDGQPYMVVGWRDSWLRRACWSLHWAPPPAWRWPRPHSTMSLRSVPRMCRGSGTCRSMLASSALSHCSSEPDCWCRASWPS